MVQLVTSNDIGEGLAITNNLLTTAVDNSTIVIENGVLVAVAKAPPVDIHLNNVLRSGSILTFDMNEGEDKTLDLADLIPTSQSVQTITEININGDSLELHYTESDMEGVVTNKVVTSNIAGSLGISSADGNILTSIAGDMRPYLDADNVKNAIKGNEATDLSGNTLGYFISA